MIYRYAGLKNAFRMQVQKAIEAHEEEQRLVVELDPSPAGADAIATTTASTASTASAASTAPAASGAVSSAAPLHAATSSSGSVYVSSRKQLNVEEAGGSLPLQVRANLAAAFQKVGGTFWTFEPPRICATAS
jgi:hypothetical protein